MKIVKRYVIPTAQFTEFIKYHSGETFTIRSVSKDEIVIHLTDDYTESEFNTAVLLNLMSHVVLTEEEKNALNYAIGSIQTLADMGVLT